MGKQINHDKLHDESKTNILSMCKLPDDGAKENIKHQLNPGGPSNRQEASAQANKNEKLCIGAIIESDALPCGVQLTKKWSSQGYTNFSFFLNQNINYVIVYICKSHFVKVVLTCTHNQCFELSILQISKILKIKFLILTASKLNFSAYVYFVMLKHNIPFVML